MYGVSDRLVLRTLDGAADLLVEELRARPSITSIHETSTTTVECTVGGPLGELAACTLYSTLAIPLPVNRGAFLCSLEQSRETGILATLRPRLTFRVGVDDTELRRTVIAAVETHIGWTNRPGNWDVNLTQSASGWIAHRVV